MTTRLTPTEYAAVIDAAKERAHALRQEAIRNGWHAIGHALLRAGHAARLRMQRRAPATIAG